MAKTLKESIGELVEPIVSAEGMEIIDIEYFREPKGWVLRFYIDREGGVTLDHCSRVSKQIGDLLEIKDLIPHSYILEVSSPGLNRPLKREKDFITHVGNLIKVKTYNSIDQKKNFQGTLLGYRAGNVVIRSDNQEIQIPFPQIAKAHILYQFPGVEKKAKKEKHRNKGNNYDIGT